jgi:hypothetical protein
MNELQTRFLVIPHSFEILILAESIIIRLNSMMMFSVPENLILLLWGKQNVSRPI